MSEESPKLPNVTIGRPTLPLANLGEIFGRLAVCDKGSPEFRSTRREMATKFDRTERAIDQIYERQAEAFLTKNGRAPATAAARP